MCVCDGHVKQALCNFLIDVLKEGKGYLKRSVSSWLPSLNQQTEPAAAAQQEDESEQVSVCVCSFNRPEKNTHTHTHTQVSDVCVLM